MHRHAFAKRGYFLGKVIAGVAAQPVGPFPQHFPRSLEQPADVGVPHPLRECHWRQPGAVQNLVRVRIADAAEEPGIGQRPLQRMVLPLEGFPEVWFFGFEHLQPARIVSEQGRLAAHQVQ